MSSAKRKRGTKPRAVGVEPRAVPELRPGPKGGARDEKRRENVKILCDAALRLFLAQGIEGTRIEEITSAAGVAKGSFYRHFADKAAIVETLFAPVTAALSATFVRCEDALRTADQAALVPAYMQLGMELGLAVATHTGQIRLYLQERRAPGVGARGPLVRLARLLEKRTIELSIRARERGLLRNQPPPEVTSLVVIGAAEQLLFAFLSGANLGNPAEVPAMLVSIMLEGMRPR